jgi:hypothetical protein
MTRLGLALLLVLCLLSGSAEAQPLAPTEAEAWREDLRFMAQALERTHKNLYHAVSREDFAARVAALDARRNQKPHSGTRVRRRCMRRSGRSARWQ